MWPTYVRTIKLTYPVCCSVSSPSLTFSSFHVYYSELKQPPKAQAPEEDCSPPKSKRQRVNTKNSRALPIHKGEAPVIKQEVDLGSSSPDPVDNLGVDRCQNEYWYIPSMPHYLFVKSRVTNTWGHYKSSTQVRSWTGGWSV